MEGILRAWLKILAGYNPNLSIELTRECPLRCPGCYAYTDGHLGGGMTLREIRDLKGQALIDGVLQLVARHKPLHVSIVGGEPLVRFRELDVLLPRMSEMGIYTQLVTSAVRPIPPAWAALKRLQVVVSIDGLPPEHDRRRAPATYDRILQHIAGHLITVHCTVTRQQTTRPSYIEEFVRFWSDQAATKRIWISLYTSEAGEVSDERLTPNDRRRVIADLLALRQRYPKLDVPAAAIEVYADPPPSPDTCIFARTTTCLSADLERKVTPCQLGGTPECNNCGCYAAAGLTAVGRHNLAFGLRVGTVFDWSMRVGARVKRLQDSVRGTRTAQPVQAPASEG